MKNEEKIIDKPINFEFSKYRGIIMKNGDIIYYIKTSKIKNKFNYNDVKSTPFPYTDNQIVKMYVKINILKKRGDLNE